MSDFKIPPYILQELPDITETVKYPIKNIQRIKYTCFDISRSLIAFGATSGGIYVFNRWPCEFVQLIPSKDGPITRLAISPDEKHIGFANGKGFLTVTECDQSHSNGYSSTSSKEHQGNEVTAMVWSRNMLFAGDDVGKVSVLQVQGFIAKTIFQSSSQTIMSLDSRICQLDSRDCMILVSTLTRCYICNTTQEQYRQIGQKLRDGEFGACFANAQKPLTNGSIDNKEQDFTEVKKYNIVDDDARFIVGEEFSNTVIFCARPSSRLWEATVDGMVQRTHQFKQVLAKHPMKVVSLESYEKEKYCIEDLSHDISGQSINFSKIYSFNDTIFAFNKNAIYFLNFQNVDNTVWFDTYKDIVECKLYNDMLYVWLANGSLISLKFMNLDRFLVKCYFDEKFLLCAELCTVFKDYLLSQNLSPKLNVLVGLRDKLDNNGVLKSVEGVLEKFDSLKSSDATQMNSGIYVLENTYHTQSLLDENVQTKQDENIFGPEAMQALKGLSITVSDKLNTSKKMLKEKWEDLKHLSTEKQDVSQFKTIQENDKAPKWISRDEYTLDDAPAVLDNDIIFKETSQDIIEVNNDALEQDKICKMLYQYSRLSLVNTESELSNLNSIIESYACDISQIYDLMLLLEKYCISIGAVDEAMFVPNNIFLTYLSNSENKRALIDLIIKDVTLYKYFVDSCIAVNIKTQKHSNIGCECGFPLPYVRTSQMPVFSELIDEFIEQQWSSQTKEQCYEVCRKMPYLWRKILYLRRNEDLINVLRILLQMLDESLLHSFLPQFTLDTWERAIQLYATLYANMCLNCNKKFEHISVKDMLSWDQLGLMIIKSVGGRNAVKVMQKHANLIEFGALTVKFYYACLLVALYEKYDCTITIPLADTIYSSYEFEESRKEIHKLLQSTSAGVINNTALPLTIAATSPFWGLKEVFEKLSKDPQENLLSNDISMAMTVNNLTDCALCGLPLQNLVLIKDGGLWVFRCGHTFHGACLNLNQIKLCPSCSVK
ncbi:BLOC-2 complex member HPS5 homolog [Maniola hyperantus]|uniref:BLOC-2 complex member HPS5 homolog n=1 Tax=Aphantopus hyperantus TaxID=2795564 RepID=UPI001567DF53|nr:Hermansky-Pudlak syndrome 5 protein homolog [Maniola hyperantus]